MVVEPMYHYIVDKKWFLVIEVQGIWSPLKRIQKNCVVNSEINCKFQVKCIHLPWESASESEVHDFMPEIVWVFLAIL